MNGGFQYGYGETFTPSGPFSDQTYNGRYDGRVTRHSVVGLDLGQAMDPAAAALLETFQYPAGFVGARDPRARCRALRRWPLGTDYCDIVDDMLELGPSVICLDYGGVGRPVTDMMRKRAGQKGYKGKIMPIQTTGSNALSNVRLKATAGGEYLVIPKVEIISALNIIKEQKLLVLPARAPESRQLLEELRDFEKLIKRTVSFEHRGPNHHGDLVIALGMACWYTLRYGRRQLAIVC